MLLQYIDPGTGSMLFSVVIGLMTMLYFVGKAVLIRLKFVFSGGRAVISKNRVPLVIYSEGKRYWNVFKPILEALEHMEIRTVFYTSSEDDPVFLEHFEYIESEFIGQGNKAFTRLNFLEADVCLMTTPGLNVYQLKRSRGVRHYSHILHSVDDATGYRLFGLDYFDSVLLSGEYQKAQIRKLEEQRGIPRKELIVVGCPYLDVLKEKVAMLPKDRHDNFTVLVAPSWGKSGILSRYGSSLLDPLVDTGYSIIVRPHPQSWQSEQEMLKNLEERYTSKNNLEWDHRNENLQSLSRADIMISDFSGVIFDYVFLFDRPFLYVNNDFDARPYDAYDVDEQPWRFRVLPEIGYPLQEHDFNHIGEVLQKVVDSTYLKENRILARETAWQFQGESGQHVAQYLQQELSTNLVGDQE